MGFKKYSKKQLTNTVNNFLGLCHLNFPDNLENRICWGVILS